MTLEAKEIALLKIGDVVECLGVQARVVSSVTWRDVGGGKLVLNNQVVCRIFDSKADG